MVNSLYISNTYTYKILYYIFLTTAYGCLTVALPAASQPRNNVYFYIYFELICAPFIWISWCFQHRVDSTMWSLWNYSYIQDPFWNGAKETEIRITNKAYFRFCLTDITNSIWKHMKAFELWTLLYFLWMSSSSQSWFIIRYLNAS